MDHPAAEDAQQRAEIAAVLPEADEQTPWPPPSRTTHARASR